jgi:RNA polymerase sigma factor (TIGR02999 family)
MPGERPNITSLLVNWRAGNEAARDELIDVVYPELRRLAAYHLGGGNANRTLQPTVLVHDLYIKLLADEPLAWQDRTHFFAVASRQLRRILIDYTRASRADKRGGDREQVTLTDASEQVGPIGDDLLALDEALSRLEQLDTRAAQVVELRFFGGLDEKEIGESLSISVATVKRDWDFARAWLSAQLVSPQGHH